MAYTTIDDPSAHFQIALYTGNAGTQTITNDGNSNLRPDLISIRSRSSSNSGALTDSTRGTNKWVETPGTGAEQTFPNNNLNFLTDGFSVDYNGGYNNLNKNSDNYVAWQWKANGGTTASNSNGTITSTVQANTTAGFSIITYTGNGTNGATIGHGLNATPELFIPKCTSTTTNWEMYYFPPGGTKQYGYLNLNNAFATWSYTAPTTTTIGLSGSGDSNGNGRTMVGYAFHSVKGYSKIGTYVGNGDADGPFVYTGFKPAWILFKRTDGGSQNWFLLDNKRDDGLNPRNSYLMPNQNSAEDANNSSVNTDFTSNGFKLRATTGAMNGNGETFFYMAFAESPFVSSAGVPTTAE